MKKFILGVIITGIIFLGYQFFANKKADEQALQQASQLIEKEINNVSKLIVTESSYAQIFSYKNNSSLFFGILSTQKKALISVNTKATIAYDLSKLVYEIDEENKTLRITAIPKPELEVYPNIEYYDVSQDYLNQFKADDYNKIKKQITQQIRKKVEASPVMKNAENRLISELQKLFVLTNSLGWKLEYFKQPVNSSKEFELLL